MKRPSLFVSRPNLMRFLTLQEVEVNFALCCKMSRVKQQNNQCGWRCFDVQPVGSNWKSAIGAARFSSRLPRAATVPLLGLQVRRWALYTLVTSRFGCFTRPRSVWVLLSTSSFPDASVWTTTLFAGSEVETSFAASGKKGAEVWK